MTTTIQIRTKSDTKKTAQQILSELGLDLTSAINMYLIQIIKHQGIPFAITTENGLMPEEEKNILDDLASAKRSGKRYVSAKAMHKAILGK